MTTRGLSPELQKYIGRVSPFVEGPNEVNKAMIRHWCEMVEDADPLYTDEDYAADSEYGGIISPPTMLSTWVYPRWWPPVEMPLDVGPAQLDLPLGDAPIPAVISCTEEYFLPVRPGDRIRYNTKLDNVSPLKKTRLGVGHFITTTNYYYNQRDELVGTTQYVLFRYRIEECLPASPDNSFGREIGLVASKILCWEDVVEGREIPSVSLEITRIRIVMIVSATRDIFPLHHDPDYAQAAGYKAPVVATAFLQGLLGRCLTDWTGPTGKVQKLSLTLKAPNYAGDTISAGGRVARKYVDNGDHKVDCELAVMNQDGTTTVNAQATVIIPSKG